MTKVPEDSNKDTMLSGFFLQEFPLQELFLIMLALVSVTSTVTSAMVWQPVPHKNTAGQWQISSWPLWKPSTKHIFTANLHKLSYCNLAFISLTFAFNPTFFLITKVSGVFCKTAFDRAILRLWHRCTVIRHDILKIQPNKRYSYHG